jgi:predicted lipoprotein with Yx(FWY)xxD motif
MFTRSRIAVAGSTLCLVLLSACTSAPTPAQPATATATAPAPSASASGPMADATTLSLRMADSSLGSILVDGKGMTLYMFTKDSANTSACMGQCLVAWPPLIGKPTAGSGVDAAKLGSFARSDGRTQATYNGWPLYYWQGDMKAGDVSGQDVQKVWYVLGRDGNPIKK